MWIPLLDLIQTLRVLQITYLPHPHVQHQMGSFQASMLEAFQSLRDELTSNIQVEVDQTSASPWKWTMVLLFLHISVLIIITHWISFLVHPRSLLRRLQIYLKNTLTKDDVEPRSASDLCGYLIKTNLNMIQTLFIIGK